MTAQIHPTAIVAPSAKLGENVIIGPFSIVGEHCEIGDGTILASHVVLEEKTILGKDCRIAPAAMIGGAPQDVGYKGEATRVRIGDGTHIRECVTVHRANGEGNETIIGNHCFLMAYSHVGHNGVLGDHVIFANVVQIAGNVKVGDYAFLGGGSMVHQNCVIGRMAFLGGASNARQDIPPFTMNDGRICSVIGINTIGLRRRGFTAGQRTMLKKVYKYMCHSDLNLTQAIEAVRQNIEPDPLVDEVISFFLNSKRGIPTGKKLRHERTDEDAHNDETTSIPSNPETVALS